MDSPIVARGLRMRSPAELSRRPVLQTQPECTGHLQYNPKRPADLTNGYNPCSSDSRIRTRNRPEKRHAPQDVLRPHRSNGIHSKATAVFPVSQFYMSFATGAAGFLAYASGY